MSEQLVDATFEVPKGTYQAKAFTAEHLRLATPEGIDTLQFLLRKPLVSGILLPTAAKCKSVVVLALDLLTAALGQPESPFDRGRC